MLAMASWEVFNKDTKTAMPLTCILIFVPFALVATLAQSWMQSASHIDEIKEGRGALQHDRALQIICLPPVYGMLAMCAMVELYRQVTYELGQEQEGVAYARYETCILVADLYEAWAVYQLGRLTFDVLEASLGSPGGSQSTGRRPSSRDVGLTFQAVSSLAWLGTWIFVIVCVFQASYSVYLWIGHDPSKDWNRYEAAMQKFSYAGLVAAGAAVYNVHIIGKVFCSTLQVFQPRLKFLVSMSIVTVAFWQLKVLLVLRTFRIVFLSSFKVQEWEISDTLQVKILHAALLIFECLLCSLVNRNAWDHTEDWYKGELADASAHAEEGSAKSDERKPLLSVRSAANSGHGR